MSYEHKGYNPWNKGMKAGTTEPMPMEIPKGYKSPFVGAEISLIELWRGKKKVLRQFHKPVMTSKQWRKENLLGLMFNGEPKETSSE